MSSDKTPMPTAPGSLVISDKGYSFMLTDDGWVGQNDTAYHLPDDLKPGWYIAYVPTDL